MSADPFFPERVPPDRRRDGYSTVTWLNASGFHVAHVSHSEEDLAAAMVRVVFQESAGAGFKAKEAA